MSLQSTKNIEVNRYELEVSVDAETFSKAVAEAFRKNVGKISLPGFRKGKAPRALVERMYGKDVFYEDALQIVYPDAAEEAIKESGLTLVGGSKEIGFDLVSMDENGIQFKMTITTKPEVSIEGYKGLKADHQSADVTDAEVAEELDRLQNRNARLVVVERAAELGDTAVIDFEGFVDGVAFEGGKGEGFSLELGSGQFIPGFEEQIVSHAAGEEFDVNVTFPEEYGAENLAGQPAVFKVKVQELKAKELPALDDEFAKDVSEFDTLDAYKDDYRQKTLERKQKTADDQCEGALIDQLVDLIKAEIPDCMFEERVDENLRDMEYRMQSQGMNMKTYLEYTGGTMEQMREQMRESAEKQVKVRLALEKIAELESVKPTEDEVEAELNRYAEEFKVEPERVKLAFPVEEIEKDLMVKAAIQLVKDNAVITEVHGEDEAAKPAKKPAAKKPAAKKAPAKKTEPAAE